MCANLGAALLLMAVLTGALSQEPSPSAGESGQPPQAKAKDSEHKAGADQRGTEQSPSVVKIPPSQQTEPKTTEYPAHHHDKSPTDWWLVLFTGVSAIATAGLVVVVFLQLCLMDRQGKWMKASERAYVKMSYIPPGLIMAGNVLTFGVEVSNLGPAPATVTDVILSYKFLLKGEPLPKVPEYFPSCDVDTAPNTFLYKGDDFIYKTNFTISPEHLADMESKDIYLLGYVDYIDQFRQRHRVGYAGRYIPKPPGKKNLVVVIKRGYNYDRPRKNGEGHDWDSEPTA